MKLGITYDLRDDYLAEGYGEEETAEFDRVDTIEGIEGVLDELGFVTDRIGNFKNLVRKVAEGHRWDMVFNIAEGLYGIGREAQVPALLDAYRIPYTFSDPLTLSLCLHKAMTKRIIRSVGITTPDFAVLESKEDIECLSLPFPLFAKPVAEGTGKGITQSSKITGKNDLRRVCCDLLERFQQPVLIETFLPGEEYTVGIVGTGKDAEVLGTMEIQYSTAQADVYSYSTKANYSSLVTYHLVTGPIAAKCAELSLQVWKVLRCRDAGRIDIRLDAEGIPNFLEINPLAGLNPTHSDLPILCRLAGLPYGELIRRILKSAFKTYGIRYLFSQERFES